MARDQTWCLSVSIIVMSTIPIIVSGYFLVSTLVFLGGDLDCRSPHLDWDFKYGVFLFLLFVTGTMSLIWRAKALQITCFAVLVITFLSIMVASWSTQFGGTEATDSKRIEECYRLESYAPWAQKFLLNDNGWTSFKKCLIEMKVCGKRDKGLFQEGCCIPPRYCGYQDANRTWVVPKSGRYANDVNCVNWSNEKTKLCYECQTCQAAYINIMYFNWTFRGLVLVFAGAVWFLCFSFTYELECEKKQLRGKKPIC